MRLESFLQKRISFFLDSPPWSNSYGLARSVIAFGTLSTFIFNSTVILFRPGVGMEKVPICSYYNSYSIFCLLSDHLELARIIAIIILISVAIGWRPRITGLLHWYVSYSFSSTATVMDGGDHITSIITFILIPLTLTDSRKWHWGKVVTENNNLYLSSSIIGYFSLWIIKIQVAIIYLNSAVAKIGVPEWKNGTALYYWLTHVTFGVDNWMLPLVYPLITNSVSVTLLTWSVILFEFILFAGLFASDKSKRWLLILGIMFHFLIILAHGLFSFFFAMSGALMLYLIPISSSIDFSYLGFRKKVIIDDN